MVDFVPLGALFGPGAPDPDFARFRIKVLHWIYRNVDTCTRTGTILRTQRILELESCDMCTRTELILQTQRILELESCDTCTRTEPILQT